MLYFQSLESKALEGEARGVCVVCMLLLLLLVVVGKMGMVTMWCRLPLHALSR